MSYFYGMPVCFDNIYHDGNSNKKKKNKKDDVSTNDCHRLSRHRRKHLSSRSRCMSKTKVISPNIKEVDNDCRISSLEIKHKRKDKHKNRLVNNNNDNDDDKLDSNMVSTPESGFMEEHSEKEVLDVKYKTKYNKLEKKFQEVETENKKLLTLLDKRETDYRELHANHDELLKHIQLVDQEKKNVFLGYKKLSTENTQLNEDVSLLKILIYRLNVELERYQDKLRGSNQKHDDSTTVGDSGDGVDCNMERKRISESWGRVNVHALGPLLEAFEESIREKDELIKQFRRECDDFGGRCKEIVAENEELRKDIDSYKLQADKLTLEMKVLVDDSAIIKEENDILIKQASIHKQKLHEIHSIYEKKVDSMSQDNNKLHENYTACRTELSNLQGKYEILSDAYDKMKKNSEKTMPVSVHSDAIDECKRLFEELKNQYFGEKKKLLSQLEKFEESNPENTKIIATLTAEKDHLKQLTRNLEKNLKRTQHKLDSIKNVVGSIQISRDSFKRQLAKTTAYCEELVTEQEKLLSEKEKLLTLLQKREKENESIKYLGNTIAQRMSTLKNQLQDVQKGAQQQLETVEKHIKLQKIGVGQLKSDYHRELNRLKQLIKQKEDVIGKLQREKFATQDNLELVWKAATSDKKVIKDVLKNTKVHNV
ncbi:hypothetical protein PV327_007561 [Microctonus hyperodae]|uniref:Uncharacterized protein n=2 Tax=Microctonus hyperodae TaxID=165561 RepID=A0AA39FZR9_MICHY|nr:hypothetical protein PV327_007561 [Microctonus hyperodae]